MAFQIAVLVFTIYVVVMADFTHASISHLDTERAPEERREGNGGSGSILGMRYCGLFYIST